MERDFFSKDGKELERKEIICAGMCEPKLSIYGVNFIILHRIIHLTQKPLHVIHLQEVHTELLQKSSPEKPGQGFHERKLCENRNYVRISQSNSY